LLQPCYPRKPRRSSAFILPGSAADHAAAAAAAAATNAELRRPPVPRRRRASWSCAAGPSYVFPSSSCSSSGFLPGQMQPPLGFPAYPPYGAMPSVPA
jgi:hypothetical protein